MKRCGKHPVLTSLTPGDGDCPVCGPEIVVSPKGSAHATVGAYRVTAHKRSSGPLWTWRVSHDGEQVGCHVGQGFATRAEALVAGVAYAEVLP